MGTNPLSMVNAEVHILHEPDGTPVTNVAFDLSSAQIAAASYAVGELLVERHRGQALETDDVLALRDLTALRDELARLADAGGHAHLVLALARLILLHDVLDAYVTTRTGRDWLREADREALPVAGALLAPMESLRAEALEAALRSQALRD